MTVLWLALASVVGWFISSLAGGGSSLILIPVITVFLGTAALPPVITIGALFGNTERTFVYRQYINWQVIRWDLPGAIVGACLGAFAMSKIQIAWLNLLVAVFLLISALNYLFKSEYSSFEVKAWYFLPVSFVYAFLSGVIGSMGPLLVPFYLNYGLEKESLLATQATTRIVIHAVKLIAYTAFGALTTSCLLYGVLIGIAAFPGNWLAHIVLEKMTENRFRQLVTSFVLVSSVLMLWQQRQVLQGQIILAKVALGYGS